MAGSDLQKLSQTVMGISQATKKTSANLEAFDTQFTKHVTSVKQAIEGSTQRKDQEVIDALEAARKAVKNATSALENASKVSSNYAKSLA